MSSQNDYDFDLRRHAYPLALLSGLYVFADKYLIDGLFEQSHSKLLVELSKNSWSCNDFLQAVRLIYTMNGKRTVGLRRYLSKRARGKLDKLVKEHLFLDIVRDLPEFTACLGSFSKGRARRRLSRGGIRRRN